MRSPIPTVFLWEEGTSGILELAARAKEKEEIRAQASQKKEIFEFAAMLFQIGIVLASATIITGLSWLAFAGGLMGIGGAILMGFALFAPAAIHLPF